MTEDDLLSIGKKLQESELCLITIQKFYKKYLCDRLFVLELDEGQDVVLTFKEDQHGWIEDQDEVRPTHVSPAFRRFQQCVSAFGVRTTEAVQSFSTNQFF